TLPSQVSPAPHWLSSTQSTQRLSRQLCPDEQSVSAAQSTQKLSAQTLSEGQSLLPRHSGPHIELTHNSSFGQSELYWQACPVPVWPSFSGSLPVSASTSEGSAQVAWVHT